MIDDRGTGVFKVLISGKENDDYIAVQKILGQLNTCHAGHLYIRHDNINILMRINMV